MRQGEHLQQPPLRPKIILYGLYRTPFETPFEVLSLYVIWVHGALPQNPKPPHPTGALKPYTGALGTLGPLLASGGGVSACSRSGRLPCVWPSCADLWLLRIKPEKRSTLFSWVLPGSPEKKVRNKKEALVLMILR